MLSSNKPLKLSSLPPNPISISIIFYITHSFYFKTTQCSLFVEVNLWLKEEPSLSHELVQVDVIGVYLQCIVLYLPCRSVGRLLP